MDGRERHRSKSSGETSKRKRRRRCGRLEDEGGERPRRPEERDKDNEEGRSTERKARVARRAETDVVAWVSRDDGGRSGGEEDEEEEATFPTVARVGGDMIQLTTTRTKERRFVFDPTNMMSGASARTWVRRVFPHLTKRSERGSRTTGDGDVDGVVAGDNEERDDACRYTIVIGTFEMSAGAFGPRTTRRTTTWTRPLAKEEMVSNVRGWKDARTAGSSSRRRDEREKRSIRLHGAASGRWTMSKRRRRLLVRRRRGRSAADATTRRLERTKRLERI